MLILIRQKNGFKVQQKDHVEEAAWQGLAAYTFGINWKWWDTIEKSVPGIWVWSRALTLGRCVTLGPLLNTLQSHFLTCIVETIETKTSAHFGSKYTKNGTIQRRLAWPLCKNDMQIHEERIGLKVIIRK